MGGAGGAACATGISAFMTSRLEVGRPDKSGPLSPSRPAGPLRVAPDGRTFVTADGEPFLWLGDTAWELFHRLDREEAAHYLTRRAAQGFTLIQAVLLAESCGLEVPNRQGAVPFHDLDPRRPNEAYFAHVDAIVLDAAERGLQVALLPTWGDKVPNARGGNGPVIFHPDNAADYGRFLGRRYRNAPVVWMLGGDRPAETEIARQIWRAMACGLREGDGGSHLITYHPAGEETSAQWFPHDSWLDFHVYQSGHATRFHPVDRYTTALDALPRRKPYLDAEPPYEDLPIRFWEYGAAAAPDGAPAVIDRRGMIARPEFFERGFFNAHDVRVHAYWNLLSGGAGFTYGHNAVWQMHRPGQTAAVPCGQEWREALERPGAQQMRHLRTLFERRPFTRLRPKQAVILGPNPPGPRHLRAAVGQDGDFALIYLAAGRTCSVDPGSVRGPRLDVTWFDPRTGAAIAAPPTDNAGPQCFTPPTLGEEADWVLVLDAPDADLAALPVGATAAAAAPALSPPPAS